MASARLPPWRPPSQPQRSGPTSRRSTTSAPLRCVPISPACGMKPSTRGCSAREQRSAILVVAAGCYELVEAADFAVMSWLLVQELEIARVEDAKEFIPRDSAQIFIGAFV